MFIERRCRIVVAVLAVLTQQMVVSETDQAPALVFMGLETSDWSPEATREIEDRLFVDLRQTGGFESVIRSKTAGALGGDLVLNGDLKRSGNQIVLRLILRRTLDGEVVDDTEKSYNGRAQLLADGPSIAQRLAELSRVGMADLPDPPGAPKRRAGKSERPEIKTRLKIGLEGVSRGPSVPGGAYLYLDALVDFGGFLGLGARYDLAAFPLDLESHLVSVAAMINFRLADSVYSGVGPAYLLSTDYKGQPTQFVGLRIAPLHSGRSGDIDEISIEVLPFSVFIDPNSREFLFSLELLSLGLWFPL